MNRICPRTGRWCELTYCEGCVPNLYPLTQPVRFGWICPRCNQVYSPDTPTCHCQGLTPTIRTGNTWGAAFNAQDSTPPQPREGT